MAWCILRTSGAQTLNLAASLLAIGLEVWTPRQMQTRRRPRSKVTQERELAIAPSFVFARARHLPVLAVISKAQVSGHPKFSVFYHGGRIPLIADSEVDGFRDAEDKARKVERRAKRRKLVMGQRVRLSEGAYAGLDGVVLDGEGKFSSVMLEGGFKMRIASWLLEPYDVFSDLTLDDSTAARAA